MRRSYSRPQMRKRPATKQCVSSAPRSTCVNAIVSSSPRGRVDGLLAAWESALSLHRPLLQHLTASATNTLLVTFAALNVHTALCSLVVLGLQPVRGLGKLGLVDAADQRSLHLKDLQPCIKVNRVSAILLHFLCRCMRNCCPKRSCKEMQRFSAVRASICAAPSTAQASCALL